MKFVHLSDLHIGKRVNGYSMLEDQAYILAQILDYIDAFGADAVLIAGDVYDKTVPSAEAVALFDDFLVKLAKRNLPTFVISGNHDSPERIAFGGRLMTEQNVFLSPVYHGAVTPITLHDAYGEIFVYLLPFVKPAHVRRFFPETEIETYTDAIKTAIAQMQIDTTKRNILLTHQFVTGAERTASEELSVGGTDNVDVSVMAEFDYVALGHIHRGQTCSFEHVRYSGTPLKYSFSEAKDNKTIVFAELKEKGNLTLSFKPFIPLRDMVELRGTYQELMKKSFYENTSYREDYVHITLTDEEDVPDAIGRLRCVYKNIMKLDYDNARTKGALEELVFDTETKSPMELFSHFYHMQNNVQLTDTQQCYIEKLIENVWEEKE